MRLKKSCQYFVILITIVLILTGLGLPQSLVMAEDGSSVWLRYVQVADSTKLTDYRNAATEIVVQNYSSSATLTAIRNELNMGLDGLLGQDVPYSDSVITRNGSVVAGTPASSSIINGLGLGNTLNTLGNEGYLIKSVTVNGYNVTVIASNGEVGALYGTFNFLRLIQTEKPLSSLNISDKPKVRFRQLDHWETERCYTGGNVWNWSALPGTVDPKYKIYARANASIGINGFVLNNVNADNNFLSSAYIDKEKALADLFRPYGIKVYLSVQFSAPKTLGGLSTADPLNSQVIQWWTNKCNEIYNKIPDFGGFLVKANSEGQPGPKDYGRTHAQGANCLANALASHGGVVLWRAFVYDNTIDTDRLKRAYKEFHPLDGQFNSNVFVQVKNGPLDFQPREPVHPLFGGMPHTPLAMEMQITQEYTGQNIQLVYLAPMWEEVLKTDTYANGVGSTVGKIIDGTVHGYPMTCMAGVANTGSDTNWTGQIFGQANWFAFGRLAWDHTLTSDAIADDWIRMTWGNHATVVSTIKAMMMGSREACVNYMTPLGLGHQMKADNHYGPDPGYTYPGHEDWSPTYYNKADSTGLGYNRSSTGSNLVSQYFSQVGNVYNDINTCPENMLMWFHHVPWTRTMQSGRTFWNELCFRYQDGVQYVTNMKAQWNTLSGYIDSARFTHVQGKLATQETDAKTWRDTCINYFKGFSGMPVPTYNPSPTPTPVVTPTPTPGNLITNPGMETGNTSGWSVNGAGTIAVSTAQKHTGTYSLYHTGRTATWNGPLQNITSKVQNGVTYTCSGWVRLDNTASASVSMTVKKTDGSGTTYTNVATMTGSNSSWVQLSGNFTLTVSGTLTELSIYFEGPASGTNFYIDDVSVTTGGVATPTPTPVVTPTPTITPTPTPGSGTTYEAESGTTLTSSLVETTNAGYTGTGYVNFNASTGAAIQWNSISCSTAGTKNIKFRYALASGTRNLDVYVNGTKVVSNTAFTATGSWTAWSEKTIQVTMNTGNNTFKVVTTGSEGPNIDNIIVSLP